MSPAVVADQITKSERDKQNMKKRRNKEERYNPSSVAAKGEDEREKKPRKNSLITDTRFASAQLDPRFQIMRKREAKVPIDSRFARMLSDRSFSSSAAPVDKRGKPRKRDGVNPLLHYYLHEKEPEVDRVVEEDEEVPLDSRFFSSSAVPVDKRGKPRKSNEVNPLLHSYLHEKDPEVEKVVEDDEELESERVEENGEKISSSLDGGTDESTSTTDDEDDDDDDDYVNSDLSRYLMANHEDTPTIEQETHRLAIVNMDWDHIKSVDLYVVMSSCLPKGGQILSVTIYPSEFGLKRMEVEAVRGPTSLIDVDEELSEEEPDAEVINEKLRAYELKKLSYYYAVAVFNSSATANHVYNTLDGTELTRTSNVFDLRFIPDYMEFKHPPRDVTEEAPTSYKEPDFQTRALQHYKVNLTWEDDEPQRVKTLRRKFNVEKLDDLNEYLASTDDSDDEHEDIEKLRALLQPNNNSDTDPSENDKDMEITFNTGLEDLSKRILEKKGKKNETVWDQVLRRQSEKRKAKKNRSKYSSDDDISDSDLKEAPEHPDDFFVEDSSDTNIKAENKKNKGSKDRMKHKKGKERPQEIEKEQEAGRAELELLFAEDEGIDKGPKGYNMKSKKIKGKKVKEFSCDEKLPNVDSSNDPRFAALYNNHLYALDPTDPHFKRSVAFARPRQKMQKQIGSKEKDEEEASDKWKQASVSSADDIDLVKRSVARLENEKHEFSSIIRSLKRNIGNMKK